MVAGVPRASRTTVDVGKVRSIGDFLHMNQISDGNHVAAIASIVYAFENDLVSARKTSGVGQNGAPLFKTVVKPTKQEILTYARANLPEIHRAMSAFPRKGIHLIGSYSRVCGMAIVISRRAKTWDAVAVFMNSVIDGEGLQKRDPIYATRQQLMSTRAEGTLTPFTFFQIVIKGWNAHRAGEQVGYFKMSATLPEIRV